MKSILIVFILFLSFNSIKGQELSNYYLPSSDFNLVSFYKPDLNGNRSEFSRSIHYEKQGGNYIITDIKKAGTNTTSQQVLTIQITSTEVLLFQSISSSMLQSNKREKYSPPGVIIKMPPKDQTTNWTYIAGPETELKCNSSWIVMNINGVEQDVLKVVKIFETFSMERVEYYVKGIGLWRTEARSSDGSVQVSDKFDGISTR
jgi:hypothetical protein